MSSETQSLAAVEAFTMHLGLALHRYGTPAHSLEDALSQVARRFGAPSNFLSAPTYIMASFGVGAAQKVYMERADQGEMNLEKLGLLDDLAQQVIEGSMDPVAASRRINHIVAAPKRFGGWVVALAFGLASAAMARLFGGGAAEMGVAGLIGLCIGALATLAERFPTLSRIFEISCATLSALLAAAVAQWIGPFSVHTATLAGVIILVPGMGLTTGMTELSTGNLISGTARLMGAAVTFMKLGFGAALGTRLGQSWFAAVHEAPTGAAGWTQWPAVILAAMALSVLLQGHPREVPWIVLNSCLGLLGGMVGTAALGPELGPFVAALAVTLGSNMHARLFKRAATVTQVPAILLLVPGSVGYRSISALLERNVLSGLEIAFSTALTAMALVVGILLANLLFPARPLRRARRLRVFSK